MDTAKYTIVALNAVLAFGLAWPLAPPLADALGGTGTRRRTYLSLIVVYVFESFAFSASMATDILSLLLAFVWGFILGRRFRRAGSDPGRICKVTLLFSLYTSLPATSFLSIPVVMGLGGWSILSAGDGFRFGVPGFLPWPLNTILGFCVSVVLVAVIGKATITTGIVRWMTEGKRTPRHEESK